MTSQSSLTAPTSDLDLWTDEALIDPYPLYDELRILGSAVYLTNVDAWAIPRYAPLRAALADWSAFSSAQGTMLNDATNAATEGIMLNTDPPEHQVMRKVLAAPLRPDQLRTITPRIREEAQGVVDRLVTRGNFDAATELAQHLPFTIVKDLVGLGDFGQDRMLDWAAATFDAFGPMNERTKAAIPKVGEFVQHAQDTMTPGHISPDGWIARLYDAEARGELPPDAASRMVIDYTSPSLDTTIFATSSAIMLFAQNPDQWDAVREDPTLIPHAINEAVRLESPIQRFARVTTREVDLDGVTIPAGARTVMIYGSGNRDERKYGNPTRFDVRRKASDHLAFGYGEHSCVGMNLARLEIRLLLEVLVERVERFKIVSMERNVNNTLRGLSSLQVTVR